MAMLAPSRANSTLTARPMPLSPPVINAVLPSRRPEPAKRGSNSGCGTVQFAAWLAILLLRRLAALRLTLKHDKTSSLAAH